MNSTVKAGLTGDQSLAGVVIYLQLFYCAVHIYLIRKAKKFLSMVFSHCGANYNSIAMMLFVLHKVGYYHIILHVTALFAD